MFMYIKMRDIEVACMSQLTKETRYKNANMQTSWANVKQKTIKKFTYKK